MTGKETDSVGDHSREFKEGRYRWRLRYKEGGTKMMRKAKQGGQKETEKYQNGRGKGVGKDIGEEREGKK